MIANVQLVCNAIWGAVYSLQILCRIFFPHDMSFYVFFNLRVFIKE